MRDQSGGGAGGSGRVLGLGLECEHCGRSGIGWTSKGGIWGQASSWLRQSVVREERAKQGLQGTGGDSWGISTIVCSSCYSKKGRKPERALTRGEGVLKMTALLFVKSSILTAT